MREESEGSDAGSAEPPPPKSRLLPISRQKPIGTSRRCSTAPQNVTVLIFISLISECRCLCSVAARLHFIDASRDSEQWKAEAARR